ncbi:ammonium transporter [Sodalinema gerasimenkoae]|uniref:ammonium transporter n=1 Tax=Sodalinema gerasimenkoae TaxID=2862348 RepID=UPI0013584F7B|nr:ammonium transporter [Sodalinema gerasimenkoae]
MTSKITFRSRPGATPGRVRGTNRNSFLVKLLTLGRRVPIYWLACIPLTALILGVWDLAATAADPQGIEILEEVDAAYVQGVLNTVWVLVASVLVIFMNAGFGMLETGMCRQKNAVNILSKNLIVFALATLAYWAIGFSLMYGEGATGEGSTAFIGFGGWFLSSGDPATYGLDPFPDDLPISVSFLFQVAFAATAATIVSGAVAERIKYDAFLIFSLLLTGIFYPISGHWVWSGDGMLTSFGPDGAWEFGDFAGSTVVHSVGGWAALVGAAILGPRMGKYEDGQPRAIPGHNMSIATLGCLILWIGWFGFNPGSELAATSNIAYIAVTTNLAAAAGGVTGTFTSWFRDGKPDLSMTINGILAGLVAITAGCDVMPYWGAALTGAIGGILVVFSVSFFDRIVKIDDPVGAISVHLVNGIWGTLAVGIFGGGNFIAQLIGVLTIGGFTVLLSFICWYAVAAVLGGIRVGEEEEFNGLDIGEHGMEAYHGFLKETAMGSMSSSKPSGSQP